MARRSLLARFRRSEQDAAAASPSAPPRRSLPPSGQLRRERRILLKLREDQLRDLGGLMLEMFRRDQFRQDLLVDRCEELIALEERLQEVETLLAASTSVRRAAPAARCACGAPLVWGSHFCANCGRPTAAMPPVVVCAKCGNALAAGARFCGVCGYPVTEAGTDGGAVDPQLLEAFPAPTRDPWEQ